MAVSNGGGLATPFAIDVTGMVPGIQGFGISFDDSTFFISVGWRAGCLPDHRQGLTIVDFGFSPFSIGHLSSSTGSAGSQIQIRGSGFGAGITASAGGQSATVNLTDENTLTITVPALSSGSKDLALTNPDGSTYVLQSAISVP
jgi:hypothetical protein